jgi:hypothetical protein
MNIAYSPEMVSYRSVNARLVGVILIQLASSLKNISRVLSDAMAAQKLSQSPEQMLVNIPLTTRREYVNAYPWCRCVEYREERRIGY